MAPIEVFFGAIVLIFALIGVTRGFLRELGVTTVMMLVLFFLELFSPLIDRFVAQLAAMGSTLVTAETQDVMQCSLLALLVVGAAFVSYEGETVCFRGQPPKGAQGVLLGLLTGALNGYLIAGSIWHYMHQFHYPLTVLGFSVERLSPLAVSLLPFLPNSFLGQPVLLGQSMFLYLGALLFMARVIR